MWWGGDTMTLQESIRRSILYSALAFVLTTVVIVGDAALTSSSAGSQTTPTPAATSAPVQLPPTFRTGIYTDHLGSLVQVDARRITYYARDNHGAEWFDLDGQRYYRTPNDEVFRTESR
jgi:hypothetical protein